jgi:class 3 adenylate cyclase
MTSDRAHGGAVVTAHGDALLAAWCMVVGHDRATVPAFVVPDDLRHELAEVTRCMRCLELRCVIRQRQVYR